MRKHWMAVLGAAALGAGMAFAAAGPAGAAGTTTTTTPKSPKVTTCSTKTATTGIAVALNDFLSGNQAIAFKYVQDGAQIAPSYALSQQLDTAAGLTKAGILTLPTKVTVTCNGKNKVNYHYTLYQKDPTTGTTTPPLLTTGGDGLILNGHWVISASSVCDLEAMAGAVAAQASNECYAAAGLPVPPAS